MTYYGLGKYGSITYGDTSAAGGATYLSATSTGYGEITLSWSYPNLSFDRFIVVRNTYGYPVDPDDGEVIHESPLAEPMPRPDSNLAQGSEVYYTIFARSLGTWVKLASAIGLSVKDFGSYDIMMDHLPAAVKTVNRTVVDTGRSNEDLNTFMRLVAFEYDRIKTQAYLIRGAIHPSTAPAALLKPLVNQMGLTYEPALGYQRMRVMAANAVRLNQSRGSLEGLLLFLKAFSGYDASVSIGKNLFLDYNASSFEKTPVTGHPGLWAFTNAAGESNTHVTPFAVSPESPSGYPNRQNGVLTVTPAGAGSITMVCGSSSIKDMIPLPTASVDYSFSIYARSSSGTSNATIGIEWFTRAGVSISTSTASVTYGASGFTRVHVTGTAPSNAAFARPKVVITSYTGDQYFDAAQFEESSSVTAFEEARRINVVLTATRINELTNPNFTTDYAGWTLTNTGGSTGITSSSGTNAHAGMIGSALELYPASASNVTAKASVASVTPSEYYTFSINASVAEYAVDPSTSDDVSVTIDWYDGSASLISNNTSSALNYRRDTASVFAEENTLLNNGCVGVESDTLQWKIGDGVTYWNSLPYASEDVIITRKLAADWSGATVLALGEIGLETDTGLFKIGNGSTAWSSLSYTTSLPVWVRPFVIAVAPENAASAKVTLTWTPSSTGAALLVDEALFEKVAGLTAFFDGSTGVEDASWLMWEGTANASRSHFYRNFTSVNNRLQKTIVDYVPVGSSFALYYAQP